MSTFQPSIIDMDPAPQQLGRALLTTVTIINGNDTYEIDLDAIADKSEVDVTWLVTCAIVVFLMQAGFSLVEASMARRNFLLLLLKNLMDVIIVSLCFWFVGYGIAYGSEILVGSEDNTLFALDSRYLFNVPLGDGGAWFFNFVFISASTTIVSGAMADRTKFTAYAMFSLIASLFVFPYGLHWLWSGTGFMSMFNPNAFLPVIDFAGSGNIHLVGGIAGMVGAKMVGPRKGVFDEESKKRKQRRGQGDKQKKQKKKGTVIHNDNNAQAALGMQTLGTLILWFCWYAFNCGSTQSMTSGQGDIAGHVAVNTTLAAAAAACITLFTKRFQEGKFMLDQTLNGVLAGLVGITAGCSVVPNWAAFFIGIIASLVFMQVSSLMKTLKIDDPVDAVAVHGACGAWGVIAAGVFMDTHLATLVYGDLRFDRTQQTLHQLAGVGILFTWAVIMSFITFTIVKKLPFIHGTLADHHGESVSGSGAALRRITSMPWMQRNMKAALVFTDVEGSTALWEAFPDIMEESIEMHNELMREMIQEYGGFEVKTEGDAFMVAFEDPNSAMSWALAVQEGLLEVEWPRDLYRARQAEVSMGTSGKVIFRGLRVRMGVHYDELTCKRDPTSGRMDFFGTMVNRAARISGQAKGGQISCSIEVVQALTSFDPEDVDESAKVRFGKATKKPKDGVPRDRDFQLEVNDHPNMCRFGSRTVLKGIRDPTEIFMVYPETLKDRHGKLTQRGRSNSMDSTGSAMSAKFGSNLKGSSAGSGVGFQEQPLPSDMDDNESMCSRRISDLDEMEARQDECVSLNLGTPRTPNPPSARGGGGIRLPASPKVVPYDEDTYDHATDTIVDMSDVKLSVQPLRNRMNSGPIVRAALQRAVRDSMSELHVGSSASEGTSASRRSGETDNSREALLNVVIESGDQAGSDCPAYSDCEGEELKPIV